MPILNKLSFITKLFSFRKTMTAASAPPVPKLGQQASVKQAPAPKQRKTAAGTHRNYKSIFARIASPFKALKKQTQSKAKTEPTRKEIENKNQSTAEIETIREQIENNMTDLKANMSSKLQKQVKETDEPEISRAYSYILNFSNFYATFTDKKGEMTSSESILTSLAGKNQREGAKVLSEHLINFCGGDKNQASTLSTLLTGDTPIEIEEQLQNSSSKLKERVTTTIFDVEMDVLMMADNTARIAIRQDYRLLDSSKSDSIITVKTTLDVPPGTPSSINLNRVDITPQLTKLIELTEST